jgi:hypothetical protein
MGQIVGAGAVYVFVKPRTGWKNHEADSKVDSLRRHLHSRAGWLRDNRRQHDCCRRAWCHCRRQCPARGGLRPCEADRQLEGHDRDCRAESLGRSRPRSLRYACEWLDRYDSNRGANAFQANHRQHIRERRSYRRRHGSSGAGLQESCLRFCEAVAGWTNENETAELSPTDAVAFDQFGFSVAIRGKTVVVGKPSLTNSGGAYVFVEPPGGWANMTQSAKLSASDGTPNDYFGSSVFTNGNLALVGAMFATVCNTYQKGAAYVFVKPAKGWRTTSNSIKE